MKNNIWLLICDIKVVRGAEIGSDHHPDLMKMRKRRKAEEQRIYVLRKDKGENEEAEGQRSKAKVLVETMPENEEEC